MGCKPVWKDGDSPRLYGKLKSECIPDSLKTGGIHEIVVEDRITTKCPEAPTVPNHSTSEFDVNADQYHGHSKQLSN
jgi:hypothetical protein